MSQKYDKQRFIIDEETWPQGQPTNYIPQYLMYHQGKYTIEEFNMMVNLIQTDGNSEITSVDSNHSLQSTKVTKDIEEIFAICKDPKFILIEGGPGMGKTILLKEIVYKWAHHQLLETFKLVFLVHLQDPAVHQVKSMIGFLQYFCEENGWPIKNLAACSDHLSKSGGKNVVFLFDGFDEIPVNSQNNHNSFIFKIIKRKVLPYCALVISSRPHVSLYLRQQATVRVHALGFTEIEQKKQFIEHTLKDQAQDIREVTQYLEHDTTISNLCFSPFNMAVLLFLHDRKLLPSNPTKLHDTIYYFICIMICRHLAKCDYSLENITYSLTNLPDPYDKIIKQLCKLSFVSSHKNQKIFTLEEIRETYPDIVATPGAINGMGLLQAMQRSGITGNTIIFSFVHFSLQQFLADRYIHLLNNELKSYFKTSSKHTANLKMFDGKSIHLKGTELSTPSDIEHVTYFLTQFPHQLQELDLHGCNIRDCGLDILYQGLKNHNNIERLSLSKNKLTSSSSSKINNLALHCKVRVLALRFNPCICEDAKLYSILSDPNSMVEELYISHTNCKLSSTITELFTKVVTVQSRKLRVLWVNNNHITNDDCDAIVMALRKNTSLIELSMFGNPISVSSAQCIIRALEYNNTLKHLVLPWYPPEKRKKITSLAKEVDEKRYCKLDLFCYRSSCN